MRRIICILYLFLSLFHLGHSWGAEPRSDSEEAAIRKLAAQVIEAAREQDWETYTGLIDSGSLKEFKDSFMPGLEADQKAGKKEQDTILLLFDGVRNIPSLIKMEPKEFLVRYLKARVSVGGKAELRSMEAKIIGTVHEEKNLVHVIARLQKKAFGIVTSKIVVISLKRSDKEWKVLQTPGLHCFLGDGMFHLGFGD